MKKLIVPFFLGLFFSISVTAQNKINNSSANTIKKQTELIPKDIIDRYFKALGGKEKLESVTSTITESTILAEGLEANLYNVKKGNKFKSVQKVMGRELIQSFDGQKGYNIDMRGIKMAIPESKIMELKKGKTLDELNYDPANFESVTTEEIDGKKYNVLTSDKGRFYFDNSTGLLYKSVVNGGVILIKEYLTVDGIKFQGNVEIDSSKEKDKKIIIKTNKITINSGVTEDSFQ